MEAMRAGRGGFTLLEVLVAMAIVAVAITTMLQLSSQSLRLLKASGEQQEATLLADRLMREVDASVEEVRTGEDGPYAWERRIAIVPVSRELAPPSGPVPALFSVTVAVRWSPARTVELTSLRAALQAAEAGRQP